MIFHILKSGQYDTITTKDGEWKLLRCSGQIPFPVAWATPQAPSCSYKPDYVRQEGTNET